LQKATWKVLKGWRIIPIGVGVGGEFLCKKKKQAVGLFRGISSSI